MKNLIRFDWAVKRLLRNKANFGILEGFLSELLGEDIKIESILESESNKQTGDNKANRVDLLVQNSKGDLVIIGIQSNYMQNYLLRMLFGTSKLVIDNMDQGMEYGKIKKVISINIVYFDLGHGADYIYHGTTNYLGINKKDILTLSTQEEAVYHTEKIAKIYPEYYIIKVNQFDDVAKNTLDEWVYFFKTQEVREGTRAKGLKEAKEKLNVLQLDEAERKEYEKYIADWRDNEGVIVGNYNKGRFEGKQETQVEMVKKCLQKGMEIPEIAELTGLSEQEINKIKARL